MEVGDGLRRLIGTKPETFISKSGYFEVWRTIVRDYSSCQLTRPAKDKLVAISGLARRCGDGRGYLAGLWRSILPSQLLWRVSTSRTVADALQSQKRRSPSLSWASIDLPIEMYHIFDLGASSLIDIRNAETFLVSDDGFGQVTGGVVQLSGFIGCIPILSNSPFNTDSTAASVDQHVSHAQDDFGSTPDRSLVYILPIRHAFASYSRPETTFENILVALWIEPTGKAAGEYTRRGYIEFEYSIERGVSYFNSFSPFLRQKLDDGCFERHDGENEKGYHRYTISLV